MTSDLLQALQDGRLRDPATGAPLRLVTRSIVIEERLDGMEAHLVRALDLGRHLAVVADPVTRGVLGGRIERALASLARIEPVLLPARPHADVATVERVRRAAAGCSALVAVGAGTVTDICRHAAFLDGKPFAVFATAPSMNGYLSTSAAITVAGHKRSLPSAPPVGAFFDLAVMAAAPSRMIRAGLGDSICRATAQADWLLAHHLRDEPYTDVPYMLLREDEPALLAEPEALLAGEPAALGRLVRTLVLSGLGMTLAGSSAPASQGEHLISHLLDMRHPDRDVLHGEQVGVTTLTMARLQQAMLERPPPRPRRSRIGEPELIARFGEELGRACWRAFEPKRHDARGIEVLARRLATRWHELQRTILPIHRPPEELERILARAGAPVRPGEIGLDAARYREAVEDARLIRERYTFLDLAADCGIDPSAFA